MTTRNSPIAYRLSLIAYRLSQIPRYTPPDTRYAILLLLVTLLTACTLLPGGRPEQSEGSAVSGSESPAVVLPQPTIEPGGAGNQDPQSAIRNPQSAVVEIRVSHVQDLDEILVQAGDPVAVGQVLARLEGYAAELSWDVRLIELELAEAEAALAETRLSIEAQQEAYRTRLEVERTQAEAAQQRAVEKAQAAREKAIAQAEAEVARLERKVEDLGRERGMAGTRLVMAQAEVDYRQRWLEVLQPLGEFDPWGDLPYLVGSQSGPQGQRSDLAYREALARAEYDLRLAGLELNLAEAEVAQLDADLSRARSDLVRARADLETVKTVPVDVAIYQPSVTFSPPISRTAQVQEASVRVNEHRLAQARAELERTVVKSLVTGKVLDVRVDRVDGDEATVIIRIMAERNE